MSFSRKIGIDLGTSTVLVHVHGSGIMVNEPALAALNEDGSRIVAIGEQAMKMTGRTPETVRLVRPLREGVINDFAVTEALLHHYISQAQGRRLFRPEVMICVPSRVTSVERRAVVEAAMSAGARQAWLIEETLAAAMGAGLAISEPRGQAICDIGGGTTEVAVISLSGLVVSTSVAVGGEALDLAIARHLLHRHDLLVGERSVEQLKIAAGSAVRMETPLTARVAGRDRISGLPKSLEIASGELADAMAEPLSAIVGAIRDVLEETPPELSADIHEGGILLSGGAAQLRGLDTFVARHTQIPVRVADDPQTCVVRGTARALHDFEVVRRQLRPA